MAENKKKYYENKVEVVGVLKELKVTDLETKKKVPMKIAEITLETGEGETHKAKMMATKYYEKDGEKVENKSFKSIQTMETEYASLADVAEGTAEAATVLYLQGSLTLNMYKGQNGLNEFPQIDARFVSRTDATPEEYRAEFQMITYLISAGTRVKDKDENDTEDVRFKAATIDYRGEAHPFEFTAADYTDEDGDSVPIGEFFEEAEKGATYLLSGELINRYIVTRVARDGGNSLGKKIFDTTRESERKILVQGVSEVDEDNKDFITTEEIKDSMAKYEAHKVEEESRETSKAKKGITKSASKETKSAPKETKSGVNLQDLPF